jgi:hypothetical protein
VFVTYEKARHSKVTNYEKPASLMKRHKYNVHEAQNTWSLQLVTPPPNVSSTSYLLHPNKLK